MARFDLHFAIVQPPDGRDVPAGEIRQAANANFVLSVRRPIAVRGMQKLINRWLKTFFTPKGSHPVRRDEGTTFPSFVGGMARQDLDASVMLAMDDASDQVRAVDARSPWLDADERLADVALKTFNQLGQDRVEIWMEITNAAGTRQTMLIPYARTER